MACKKAQKTDKNRCTFFTFFKVSFQTISLSFCLSLSLSLSLNSIWNNLSLFCALIFAVLIFNLPISKSFFLSPTVNCFLKVSLALSVPRAVKMSHSENVYWLAKSKSCTISVRSIKNFHCQICPLSLNFSLVLVTFLGHSVFPVLTLKIFNCQIYLLALTLSVPRTVKSSLSENVSFSLSLSLLTKKFFLLSGWFPSPTINFPKNKLFLGCLFICLSHKLRTLHLLKFKFRGHFLPAFLSL